MLLVLVVERKNKEMDSCLRRNDGSFFLPSNGCLFAGMTGRDGRNDGPFLWPSQGRPGRIKPGKV